MAKIIKTDGTQEELTDLSLSSLQKAVGGYIELVSLPKDEGELMIVNEEGLIHGLPVNPCACQLAEQIIVGDVVVMSNAERHKL